MGNKLCNFLLMWAWVCGARYFDMKKGLRNSEAFAFTMVEQKLLTANTIYANSVEIKLTRNWLAVITFCESPNKKS